MSNESWERYIFVSDLRRYWKLEEGEGSRFGCRERTVTDQLLGVKKVTLQPTNILFEDFEGRPSD